MANNTSDASVKVFSIKTINSSSSLTTEKATQDCKRVVLANPRGQAVYSFLSEK